jgi:DnaK suppressor protein
MAESDLATTEVLLRDRLAELEARIAKFAERPERGSSVSFGKRVGDGTTEAIGRLTEIGVGESLEATRDRTLAALERIEQGCYGVCERCKGPIAPARLRVAPESVLCIACARAAPRR